MINKSNNEPDSNEVPSIDPLTKAHIQKFGVEPIVIGVNWNNPGFIVRGILKALETGIPYDENDQLSKDELEAFNNGDLVF